VTDSAFRRMTCALVLASAWSIPASAQSRTDKRVRVRGFTPNHVNGRVDLEGSIAWLDATQVAFYGLGNASRTEDRANFRILAQNVNTIDEVPDSSWFTNRILAREVSIEEATRGPVTSPGPAAGAMKVTRAKPEGISPGFVVQDSAGVTWFVQFDAARYPEAATGAAIGNPEYRPRRFYMRARTTISGRLDA
jgi:hypothetical protein